MKLSLPFFLLFLFFNITQTIAQTTTTTAVAGEQYKASASRQHLWGSNYRNVWTTPVTVKILNLDTAFGGLKPLGIGNSYQNKILLLTNPHEKTYTIKSVSNLFGNFLSPEYEGSFLEKRFDDEGSTINPYASAAIPTLATNANTYYTNPSYVFVPKQSALDGFNETFGNDFYVAEAGFNNQNFDNYFETFRLLDTLNVCTNCMINQQALIRERLFAMFLNDWQQDEDQWIWGEQQQGDKIVFAPFPKNHEKAFSTYNGKLTKAALGAGGLGFIQPFNKDFKNVKYFNLPEKDLDRRLLNQATLNDWLKEATYLQQALTDETIDKAVQKFPKEIYTLVGANTAAILKERRAHLTEWATNYYLFLSKEVEVPGSLNNDVFNVEQTSDSETTVKVYDANNQNTQPFFSRTFKAGETNEIRLFGLKGENKYIINSNADNNIKIKLISGSRDDSVISNANRHDVIAYGKNNIYKSPGTNVRTVNDTTYRFYQYDWFNYNKKGLIAYALYSNDDRLFVSLGYGIKHFAWGKFPYASNQTFSVHYSIMENAFSFTYRSLFPQLVARADLAVYANYDDVRWTYFFGLGNDTKYPDDKDIKYYTTRTRLYIVQPELFKTFGNHTFSVFGTMQGVRVINDEDRFTSKVYIQDTSLYNWKSFGGGGISYTFQALNDVIVPTKGIYFNAIATASQNIHESNSNFQRYTGIVHIYIPLVSKFSLALRAGGATINGHPEFYQYNSIGGPTLRGIARDRYWGKTAFYNQNDLRFITPARTKFYGGKIGLLAFFDDGRVWMPGEKSNTWHTAVGGGVIIAPFNFLYADGSIGFSKNETNIAVRLTAYLNRKNNNSR